MSSKQIRVLVSTMIAFESKIEIFFALLYCILDYCAFEAIKKHMLKINENIQSALTFHF